jgi:hypothetical protein
MQSALAKRGRGNFVHGCFIGVLKIAIRCADFAVEQLALLSSNNA